MMIKVGIILYYAYFVRVNSEYKTLFLCKLYLAKIRTQYYNDIIHIHTLLY